jgi:hypothetical protein
MSENPEERPLVSKLGILVDLGMSAVFFVFMFWVLMPHVPSQDQMSIYVVAGMTSFCMTGVFWIAAGMFRVTLVDYQRRQKGK